MLNREPDLAGGELRRRSSRRRTTSSALGDAELYFDFLGHRRESEQTGYRQMTLDYRLGSPLIPANLAAQQLRNRPGHERRPANSRRARIHRFRQRPQRADRQLLQAERSGLRGDIGSEWRYDAHVELLEVRRAVSFRQSFLIDKLHVCGQRRRRAGRHGSDARSQRPDLPINLTNPAERCIPFPPLDNAVDRRQLAGGFCGLHLPRRRRQHGLRRGRVRRHLRRSAWLPLPAGSVQAAFGFEHRQRRDRRHARSEQHFEQSLQPHERNADARQGQRQRGVHRDRSSDPRR